MIIVGVGVKVLVNVMVEWPHEVNIVLDNVKAYCLTHRAGF